jgi:hypothetical protein
MRQPYCLEELARAVREVLDGHDEQAPAAAVRLAAGANESMHDGDAAVTTEQA